MKTQEVSFSESTTWDDTVTATRDGDDLVLEDGNVDGPKTLSVLAAHRTWKVGEQVKTICGLGDSNMVWGLDGDDRSAPFGSYIYKLHKHLIGHPQFWGAKCYTRARSGYTSTESLAEYNAGTETITGAANSNPGVANVTITAADHGFVNGVYVDISDLITSSAAVDQLVNGRFVVAGATTDTFELTDVTTAVTYSSGGVARYSMETMSYDPDIGVIALGTNDMIAASVDATALALLLANLESIVDTMLAADVVPILATIPSFAPSTFPTPWGNQTVLDAAIIAWNVEIQTLALRKSVPLFDIWGIVGQAGASNLYFQEESLTAGYYVHFSVNGQERVAADLARFLSIEVAGSGVVGGPRALPVRYADPEFVYSEASLTAYDDEIVELTDTTSGLNDIYMRGDYHVMEASAGGAILAITWKFIGTGFVLLGATGDEGIINVEVDSNGGEDWDLCEVQDGSLPLRYWGGVAWYRKLEEQEHTVTVTIKNTLHTSATNYRFRFLGAMIEGSMLRLLDEKTGLAQRRADANGCELIMTKSRGEDTAASANDMMGQILARAKNTGSPKTVEDLARLIFNCIASTDGAETGQFQFRMLADGGEAIALTIGGAVHPGSGVIIDKWGNIGIKYLGLDGALDKGSFFAWSDTDDTASSKMKFQKSRAGAKPSDDDVLGLVTFEALNDSSSAFEITAFIAGVVPTSSNGAMTGALGFATALNGVFKYHTWMKGEEALTYATTVTPDAANGTTFGIALTGNVTTFNVPANAAPGSKFTFRFVQDTSPRTVAFAAGYKWAGGSAPTISAGSGAVDVIEVYTPDGTTFYERGRFQNQS